MVVRRRTRAMHREMCPDKSQRRDVHDSHRNLKKDVEVVEVEVEVDTCTTVHRCCSVVERCSVVVAIQPVL